MSQSLAAKNNLARLPGATFGEDLLRSHYRKPQVLSQIDQGAPKQAPVSQFETTKLPVARDATWQYTTSSSAHEEVWKTIRGGGYGQGDSNSTAVGLDRKVLRFKAYFREPVFNSAVEKHRVRTVLIHYYLEDDTVSVSEPRQDNSGIPGQGAFLKRHQIPKPDASEMFTYNDFEIGADVTMYGRTFHIVDCDAFTRRFLQQLGKTVPDPEEGAGDVPTDQYLTVRKAQAASMQPKKNKKGDDMDYGTNARKTITSTEIIKTKQFLSFDKQVLKFGCVWDDRENPHGDVRTFYLFYFLSDDTIEIIERDPPNCGRDPFPSFVKRSKVPKPLDGRYQNPNASLVFKNEMIQYYTDADIRIGVTLNVFGRSFLVNDCDSFTAEYLKKTYGIEECAPLNIEQASPPKATVEPPVHNGFGDEEDSLQSWKYLVPSTRVAKRDANQENADRTLKFQVIFDGGDATNAVRRFVITVYLMDNTISIFEPPQRNTGINGGKFLNRQKVRKVREEEGVPLSEYISPSDFHVGGYITINCHKFRILSADEQSLRWMESHPLEFPKANVNAILSKLRKSFVPQIRAAFENFGNIVGYRAFANTIESLKLPLVAHEILTVMRYFDRNGDGNICVTDFFDVLALSQS